VLAQLITVAALGVFMARCLLLLIRTATTGHRTRYVGLLKHYLSAVVTLGTQIHRAAVQLHNLIAEQIPVLVLAADNRLPSWWPSWRRHGRQPAHTIRPSSCGALNNRASASSMASSGDSKLTGVGGNSSLGE
jgi:uncharacterized membrane protein YgcG